METGGYGAEIRQWSGNGKSGTDGGGIKMLQRRSNSTCLIVGSGSAMR